MLHNKISNEETQALPAVIPTTYKLYKQHSSCTARSSFFTEHVVNIWNSLPADTDFSSLSGFIRQINMNLSEFRSLGFY